MNKPEPTFCESMLLTPLEPRGVPMPTTDPVGGEVEVRICQDYDAVLAAQLERDALQAPGGPFGDPLPGRG